MAKRLVYSLDRGRHYRRTGSYVLRKIMDSGRALGGEIRIIGNFANQKVMTHVYRAGTITKNDLLSNKVIDRAVAFCIQNSGVIGVIVKIQHKKLTKPKYYYTLEEEMMELTKEDKKLINDFKENERLLKL
ncbi:MAG: hypothetical protein ACFFA3_20120 [Promethearchaeota archaeon]